MSAVKTLHPAPLFPDLPLLAQPAVFAAWKPECHRSTMTARAFGLDLWLIAPLQGKATWRQLLRYALSTVITAWLLLTQRPRTLFILNQPMPLALVARVYSAVSGARLVLDSHSKAFAADQPALSRVLYRWIARGAWFNINHNRADAAAIEAIGAKSLLVPEIAGLLVFDADPAVVPKLPAVLAVCSFAKDEPVALLLASARALPDVTFYFTGNWRISPEMQGALPANVVTLGFVARETYLTYAARVSAVVTLSIRADIMQMAAEEALCLGTPIVTNHSPILEEVFTRGTVFTTLEADALAAAIRRALDGYDALATGMRTLAAERSAQLRDAVKEVAS